MELLPEDAIFMGWYRFVAFPSEQEAHQSLEAGKIQAYYVLAEDYLMSGNIRLVAKESVPQTAENGFIQFLRRNMIKGYPKQVQERLLYPVRVTISTPDESTRSDSKFWLRLVYPLTGAIMLMLTISTSGEYLLKAIVEEKENRTIEVLITSVPTQTFMIGKTLGNMCVGLTQLLVWMLYPLWAGVILWAEFPSIAKTVLGLPLVLSLVLMLLAFILVSSVLVIIGMVTVEHHHAQQISTLFTLVLMSPFYALYGIIFHPNWWFVIGMSLFPLTAPLVMPLRVSLTVVPVWQILLCVGLLTVSACWCIVV